MERKGRGGPAHGAQANTKGVLMNVTELIGKSKVYDLGQPYYVGMPHFPTHPPYLFTLTKLHGEFVLDNGASSSSDAVALGTHVGTHIDALSHFSCDGKMHGGIAPVQSYGGGIAGHSVDTIAPIIRAVLFDIARLQGVDTLPRDFTVTPEHLDACGVEPSEGGIALIRTGWAQFWSDSKQFLTGGHGAVVHGPGPTEPAARWLSQRKIFAAGSDTVAFERAPSQMEVHVHLIVQSGIHIIECLNLEELARDGVKQFTFIALPLKIRGATGSPIRPIAIPE
jgi:kynurenine formamidase